VNSSSGTDSSTAGPAGDDVTTVAAGNDPAADDDPMTDDAAATVATPPEQSEGLGRRGWVLVGVVVVSTLVVPGIIYLRPATPGTAGLPFLASMLALPMVPALLLGAAALWSVATRDD
jgi:hypothetical protein